jgi:apolipoprotein N-acyltransferase
MQVSAVGGIYFLTILTIFWMATPTLAWQARQNTKIFKAVLLLSAISFTGFYAYGATRLNNNPTKFRNDFAVIIVQPNIPQSEKWADGQAFKNFMTHIELSREALDKNREATVALVWPETSLDENLLIQSPEAARILTETLSGRTSLISGMWRETKDGYYNSIASLSAPDGKLHINGIYDKHHLVPFGEYLPFEKYLNLTPLVGFAGFQKGHGPAVISSEAVPPFASLLCFETIFPWYAQSTSADWIVNTSNDGWYGNTPGPYQHLAMTQFRAVEQGKPIARAATTGVSALIDSYGRITQRLDYEKSGAIISQLPKILTDTPFYQKTGEALFFLVVSLFLGLFFILQNKEV